MKADSTGTVPQRLLAVAWMTYAFVGCTGPIAADTAATFEWGDLPNLGGSSLTTPIRHGIYQIVPEDWTGATEDPEFHEPPAYNTSRFAETLAEARLLPYWRDPVLPAGWTFADATSDPEDVAYGYIAAYQVPEGYLGVRIEGAHATLRGWPEPAVSRSNADTLGVAETRLIAGRPALVQYSPAGPSNSDLFPVTVWVYDAATQSRYRIAGYDGSLLGSNIDAVIAIARSLFEPPNPR
ncbi:MAG: hypothetical protein OXG19_09405 [Chloroflexi bacterium]|nr:hypothetical protein [Chloroflexota bacterium]